MMDEHAYLILNETVSAIVVSTLVARCVSPDKSNGFSVINVPGVSHSVKYYLLLR
jgi:hypothetical protein